jgi:cytochrome P450
MTYRFGRDPLGFLTSLAHEYGDLASYRMGGELVFFVNDPRSIRDILVTDQRNFTKSRGLERTKRLLGQGLLTSEGALHLRQRRLMQPAFHHDRIAAYADTMVACAGRLRDLWTDGAALDVAHEMMQLTLAIAGRTLFDIDVASQAAEVGRALTAVMEPFWLMMTPAGELLEHVPFGRMRRARAARAQLDRIVYGFIADRRRHARDQGDLLSMLLAARDEDGSAMTDQQVRDEAMTILLGPGISWIAHPRSSASSMKRSTRRSTAGCPPPPTSRRSPSRGAW